GGRQPGLDQSQRGGLGVGPRCVNAHRPNGPPLGAGPRIGPRARLEDSDNLQDVTGETLAAGVRRLPRASELSGSGLSNALPIGVLGHGSVALPGGVQARSATSPSPAPAAGAPSAGAAGSSQEVPLVSTPAGRALGVAAYRVRDQEFPSGSVHRPEW